MTNLAVAGAGYVNASQVLADANRMATVAVGTLASSLADGGAMAGDSSFASEFAASYDEAAAAVLAGWDDAIDACASLCRLTHASYENHYRAEESSIASTVVVSTSPSAMSQSLYAAATPVPPSSLGGDPSSLPGWANVILDHVEGFVWPDADVDRLRSTAGAWRTAADRLDHVADLVSRAIPELFEERSPEILVATGVVAQLAAGIREIVVACGHLAQACDDYAGAVEAQRQLILDLASDLIRDAVLIAAAGFVLGLVSGGGGNAVAMWINSGKLAAQVPRFKAFVDAVRVAGSAAAVPMRAGTAAVVRVQDGFLRMASAGRVTAATGSASSAVGKARRAKTWLETHEGGAARAHTLEKHVGKSDDFLQMRLAQEPNKSVVSTFTDEATAERSIRSVLAEHSSAVRAFMQNPGVGRKRLESVMPNDVGRIMRRGVSTTEPASGVRVILVKDASMPDGYRILTAMVQ